MRYNEQKRVAIKESFSRIDEDLSTIRARLVPIEEYQATREELATEVVDEILEIKLDYQAIEGQALEQVWGSARHASDDFASNSQAVQGKSRINKSKRWRRGSSEVWEVPQRTAAENELLQ